MNRYFEIAKHLNDAGVRYLIAGGFAANMYGVPRMTQDIDLIVEFEKENLLKLENTIKGLGFSERVPVFARDLWDIAYRKTLRDTKNMLAFTYHDPKNSRVEIDLILDQPFTFEELWDKQESRYSGDGTIMRLVSVDQLIAMKAAVGRSQDMFDVVHLKKIYGK